MTAREYAILTEKEMRAKRWVTNREVELNNGMSIKAGVEVEVYKKFGGVWIRTPKCPHCGVTYSGHRVPFPWVDEIPQAAGQGGGSLERSA